MVCAAVVAPLCSERDAPNRRTARGRTASLPPQLSALQVRPRRPELQSTESTRVQASVNDLCVRFSAYTAAIGPIIKYFCDANDILCRRWKAVPREHRCSDSQVSRTPDEGALDAARLVAATCGFTSVSRDAAVSRAPRENTATNVSDRAARSLAGAGESPVRPTIARCRRRPAVRIYCFSAMSWAGISGRSPVRAFPVEVQNQAPVLPFRVLQSAETSCAALALCRLGDRFLGGVWKQ